MKNSNYPSSVIRFRFIAVEICFDTFLCCFLIHRRSYNKSNVLQQHFGGLYFRIELLNGMMIDYV